MNIALSTGLDLLIVAILLICIVLGCRKGLVRSVIGFFGKIISLVAAFFLSENLGTYLDKNYIHNPMRQWLVNQLSPTSENINAPISALDLDSLFNNRPDFFVNITNLLNINIDETAGRYFSIKEQGIEQAKAAIIDFMVSPVSAVISRIAAFLIIFIVCAIGVAVLWWLSDLIINLPIVRQLDTLGGFVFGALNGILIVFVTVSVIGLTSQYLLKDMTYEEKQNIVEGTILYEQFQNINPITSLLGVESETK